MICNLAILSKITIQLYLVTLVFPLILVNLLIVDDFLETFQRFILQFWVF